MKPMRIILILTLALVLGACSIFPSSQQGALTASGTVAATNVNVAPEISGKVTEVDVSEGDSVKVGDVLFKLDCQTLDAQHDQAKAAVDVANSALDAANAQLQSAQAQYDLTAQNVQQQNTPNRVKTWDTAEDSAFNLPNWYFQPNEEVTAAQAAVDAAQKALDDANTNLQNELAKASNSDFVAAEKRLDQAQVAYQAAKLTNNQAIAAANNNDLKNASQDIFDAANNELTSAQDAYNSMLSSSSAQSVLEARAKVAAATAQLDNARDQLASLQTGGQSLQLQAASAQVDQAKAAVSEAQNNITQANASLSLIELQQSKCTVTASMAGVISTRNLEVGEMAAAGGTVMVISQLNPVTLTVYVPEDRYGQVKLGEQVSITVDSFPGETFTGTVQYISSEAEFTPRDVQTVSGREATVYAVKINVPNDKLLLKDGMAADVTFK